MTDSTNIAPYAGGDGVPIATDLVNGIRFQRAKITYGEDGSATDVSEANPRPTADVESNSLLRRILQMLRAPLGYDKAQQRQRVTAVLEPSTLTTVTTITTVATVSAITALNNITAIGGYSAQMQIRDTNRAAWALAVRSRIT